MNWRSYFSHDLPSAVVVFLVALPLCLGIALASGAPLLSGIVAGVVGGIVAGYLSASPLSVSGPAAGLTTVVLASIKDIGSYEGFLTAVVIAGILQILLGYLKAGAIGHFIPAAVIKGMLAAIGLILILKQIPHAVGYDADFEGDETFFQADGENTFTEILRSFSYLSEGAMVVSVVSILLLVVWSSAVLQRYKFFQTMPGPLVVVVLAMGLETFFDSFVPALVIESRHMVSLPNVHDLSALGASFSTPDFSLLLESKIYLTALTIAIVASLETLLSIEACDKMDPFRRITPLNRELKAQGVANTVSGLLGGLPLTSVIVRSSANITAGARSKASAITHGFILLFAILFIPSVLNHIPLASLAGILIYVGYKLTSPKVFKEIFSKGWDQTIPFVVTIVAILFSDLLTGIFIGILVGAYFVLRNNYHDSILMVNDGKEFLIRFTKDISFLNKKSLREKFSIIPPNASVIIDGTHVQFIDADILEAIEAFQSSAQLNNIQVEIKKSASAAHPLFKR